MPRIVTTVYEMLRVCNMQYANTRLTAWYPQASSRVPVLQGYYVCKLCKGGLTLGHSAYGIVTIP